LAWETILKTGSKETFVAHSLSANKRIRQTAKRRERNRARKGTVRTQLKAVTKAFTAKDATASDTQVKKAVMTLDKIVAKGTMHKNTASRKKSRLMKQLNALKAAAK
jgi:small subunit ribosomal protein S20